MKTYENSRNPLLPPEYHTPDCEAHVMPDGKLYLYGSYDNSPDGYCSTKYNVISTPDLKSWNVYEDTFSGEQVPWFNNPDAPAYVDEDPDGPTEFVRNMRRSMEEDDKNFVLEADPGTFPPLLFAPDCIERDGKYYLYFCMVDGSEGVAVSDRPEGPFHDPVRLPCSGIDPAIFIDSDKTPYYYWGQFRSLGVKLSPDMVSFDRKDIRIHLLTEEEHHFHEGSSMRKIGDTYYAVFADISRGKPTSLGYATGKSPLGPFTYRGVIIDNTGCDPSSWNNHGSIECFNGQWYVFYHRSSRNTNIFRRVCMEPITILPDGTIPEVKMTSQGAGAPFGPGERIMGYQACGLTGQIYIDVPGEGGERPAEALMHIAEGDTAVFRYVCSGSPFTALRVQAKGSGRISVLLNGKEAGEISVKDGKQIADGISFEAGEYELELRFSDCAGLELDWLELA